jgi:flagellar protein FlbD
MLPNPAGAELPRRETFFFSRGKRAPGGEVRMIELTKLNRKKFVLNCELIESVESTPDTVVTLRNGKLIIVAEPPQEVVRLTIEYKRGLFSGLIAPLAKGDANA